MAGWLNGWLAGRRPQFVRFQEKVVKQNRIHLSERVSAWVAGWMVGWLAPRLAGLLEASDSRFVTFCQILEIH